MLRIYVPLQSARLFVCLTRAFHEFHLHLYRCRNRPFRPAVPSGQPEPDFVPPFWPAKPVMSFCSNMELIPGGVHLRRAPPAPSPVPVQEAVPYPQHVLKFAGAYECCVTAAWGVCVHIWARPAESPPTQGTPEAVRVLEHLFAMYERVTATCSAPVHHKVPFRNLVRYDVGTNVRT